MRAFFRFLKLFFAGDPYPETPATRAAALLTQQADRDRWNVDEDGKVRRLHGLSEIMKASQDNVVYFGAERRRLLAKHLIDECGQVTGPAWTFERREK